MMVRRQGDCSPPRTLRYVACFALRLGVCASLATSEINEAVAIPPPPKTSMSLLGFGLVFEDSPLVFLSVFSRVGSRLEGWCLMTPTRGSRRLLYPVFPVVHVL